MVKNECKDSQNCIVKHTKRKEIIDKKYPTISKIKKKTKSVFNWFEFCTIL